VEPILSKFNPVEVFTLYCKNIYLVWVLILVPCLFVSPPDDFLPITTFIRTLLRILGSINPRHPNYFSRSSHLMYSRRRVTYKLWSSSSRNVLHFVIFLFPPQNRIHSILGFCPGFQEHVILYLIPIKWMKLTHIEEVLSECLFVLTHVLFPKVLIEFR
jgi:hypothetical protein